MEKLHNAATHHLPAFITASGNTDVLMVVSAVFIVLTILGAGVFFLWLHSLPERMVHNKLQYDLVAVLALLSLFTHIHAFWIAALLLAFVTIPNSRRFDILTPLRSIAKSLRSIADRAAEPELAESPGRVGPVELETSDARPAAKEE